MMNDHYQLLTHVVTLHHVSVWIFIEKFHLNEKNINNNSSDELDTVFIRKLGIKLSNLSKIDKKKLPYQKTLFDYVDKDMSK